LCDLGGFCHNLLHSPGREVRRVCIAVTLPERHHHAQRPAPCIDVLDNLIVGKPRRPAMLIVQRDNRVVSGRTFQDLLGDKLELLSARQLRPGLVASCSHDAPDPPMTLTLRNRACEAAWVIQPD